MQTLFPPEKGGDKAHSPRSANSWIKIKQKLKEVLDPDSYAHWIEPLTVKTVSDSEVVIILPDVDFYQEILDHVLDKFDYCKNTLGIDTLFRFEIAGSGDIQAMAGPAPDSPSKDPAPLFQGFEAQTLGNGSSPSYSEPNPATPPPAASSSAERQGAEGAADSQNPGFSAALTSVSNLNKEYIFESFVNGPSNQFAHASCQAVADAPGTTYNPLFLYGSTGLGKTHLLHAVGNKVLKDRRGSAVITYISSERFMNEMIYCLRFNKMWDFRKKYRSCDVLLVDDIQFISGKERTQEEFFHTFNSLYEAKKQIVVTSDIFPQDIQDIEDRLRNRFQWGLVADLQPPDVETRVAILINKAEKQRIQLSSKVAQFIAERAKGNVRVLEGALRRVIAFASLQGRPIDSQLASEILQNMFEQEPKKITVELIQKVVAEHYRIKVADIKSKKRNRELSVPRQVAMYFARIKTDFSFPQIGERFGGKDHTTVMHAYKKISTNKDLDLKTNLETIERKLDQV